MINFCKKFEESQNAPITIDGVTYYRLYELNVGNATQIVIDVESIKYVWKQAVHLSSNKPLSDGKDKSTDFVFWFPKGGLFRSAVKHAECSCEPKSKLQVWNVWMVDNAIQSLYNGSAMIVTQIAENKWRFQCNDGHPDDDMNDLIFTLELK